MTTKTVETAFVKAVATLTAHEIEGIQRPPRLIVANACLSGRVSERSANGKPARRPGEDTLLLATLADEFFKRGVRESEKLRRLVWQTISAVPLARIDYVEVVDSHSLEILERVPGRAVIATAVFFGSTRLIDNIQLS